MSDFALAPDSFKQLVDAKYNPDAQELAQPLSNIRLTSSTANPGGDQTLWLSTNGSLYIGAVELGGAAGGADEEFDYLGTATGPYGTAPAVTMRLQRFGDMVVVMNRAEVDAVPSATDAPIQLTPAFPLAFRPVSGTIQAPLLIKDEGTRDIGIVLVSTAGNVTIRPTPDLISVFTAPSGVGNTGFPLQMWTYHIA